MNTTLCGGSLQPTSAPSSKGPTEINAATKRVVCVTVFNHAGHVHLLSVAVVPFRACMLNVRKQPVAESIASFKASRQ